MSKYTTMDGNTAVAHIAYRVNEICAIFPITPSSTMAELADEWSAKGITNIWGNVPVVQEMQSEGGAAGAVHGALQSGALTTTFTSSQGLMLMLPNMIKIAGELTCAVFHIASRSLATSSLSIFGDHSDVMTVRTTGFALLSSASVQEAHDQALIAQAVTLMSRVPVLHFFDGFRTSHELNTLILLSNEQIRAMIDDRLILAHRARALNPEHAFIRGTAQNPDTFFQAREAVNPYYADLPDICESVMVQFAALTGRHYHLFEYTGAADAEHVIIVMGSGAETVKATVKMANQNGRKIGVIQVRLFRPFSASHFLACLPDSVKGIAVIEQCKEVGASGEPLYLDVVSTLAQDYTSGKRGIMPKVIGGRYGLGSKDFSPGMVMAVFAELQKAEPKNGFTVGIDDDLSHTSLSFDAQFAIPDKNRSAVFYGLGADGTVGANKNTVKILAESAGFFAQGYFVYDSHKSGAQTVSHLRYGHEAIHAPYLISSAEFVACHHFDFLFRQDLLGLAAMGATFLLNSPFSASTVWDQFPRSVQQSIINKQLKVFVIDAQAIAEKAQLGNLTNTILQTCFFALSEVLPLATAIAHIKTAISNSYSGKSTGTVEKNHAAVDMAIANMHEVKIPDKVSNSLELIAAVPPGAPIFIQKMTAKMLRQEGNSIPVSVMPADGSFPSGTAVFEKRNISDWVAEWNAETCIQCGQCSIVCPHSVIRAKFYNQDQLSGAPANFKTAAINARGYPEERISLDVYLEDCTGCGLCVEACPVVTQSNATLKAINLVEKAPILESAKEHLRFFETIPVNNRSLVDFDNVRGVQFLQPLFEFPGACAGCGETPYLKLLSQLFGDRAQIANATGCSSIYGGNLPVTPWSVNAKGQGPAWSNSLFEDNAEFGFGFRLAADKHLAMAKDLLKVMIPQIGDQLVSDILGARQIEESEIQQQRLRIASLKKILHRLHSDQARNLLSIVDHLVRRSIWLVGGDGWAYDIDSGGLDHVLASGRNVNVLVLDTEVYSNTGGQASKATPLGAVAKFAAAGKRVARKDLALQAIAYGNIYVAQVAMGSNPQQCILAFREAEAYDGPSIILAYSHCIAHGIDMRHGMRQQQLAVKSGFWPLLRFNPALISTGVNPFCLDSLAPDIPLQDYAYNEIRFSSLITENKPEAAALLEQAQQDVLKKYLEYQTLSELGGQHFSGKAPSRTPSWSAT
ncbi:pyruvate:ferredoxin (flavodoxin) oxidoreductase [Undibacterium sp. Ji67W]|uniref:pyruvate:ferredoxin (flavodoxin) oxidoreductase n=1 Tax=Undibacterium sp. Ji67W TaxID=3413042 RepID=UPI003BF3802E